MDHQLAPEGDWRTWVILGGRGAGKTRAGAEWVRSMVEGDGPLDAGKAKRVALVAETIDQAREVMVMGDSGILACSPPDRKPTFNSVRGVLRWPNGAEAYLCSAHNPESLRGPQFDAAWADELAKWKNAQEAWTQLQMCLRLGHKAQQVVTTTPRPVAVLKRLLELPSTVRTHAPTEANRANLAPGFIEEVRMLYGGTSLGRQELDGEMMEDIDGALWERNALDALSVDAAPVFDRVVVAIDPAAKGNSASDECGIIVAGAVYDADRDKWRAVVIEDATVQGASPSQWAAAAIAAARRHNADRVVAETNQGGDMVEATLRTIDANVSYQGVHASRGKSVRAEPIASLYEQGKVRHMRGLGALEDQMCLMTRQGFQGQGSPDRVDALVWALTELMISPPSVRLNPTVRTLR